MMRPVSDCCLASLDEVEGHTITYYACRECSEPCHATTGAWEAVT